MFVIKLEFNVILSELWMKDSRKVDTESLEFGVPNFVVGQVRQNEKLERRNANIKREMFCFQRLVQKVLCLLLYDHIKVKFSRYWPGVAQTVGRGIALLFHDCGTRRGWVVSSTPRPHFTPGKDPVPVLQEAGWAPGPVWTGGKSRPHRDSIPDRPARSQSLYWLSYPAHMWSYMYVNKW